MKNSKLFFLLVGGGGFVGAKVCKALSEKGAGHIFVLDVKKPASMPKNAMFIQGNIADAKTFSLLPAGMDVVYHFAGIRNTVCEREPETCFNAMALGTENVFRYAVKARAKKIIFSSSAIVYGEPKYSPIDEEHPLLNTSCYGLTKRYGELLLFLYSRMVSPFEFKILRYFNIYGPGMPTQGDVEVMVRWIYSALEGKPIAIFGNGKQEIDFVHIEDVVQANLLCLEDASPCSIYNIGSGKATSLLELHRCLEKVSRKKIKIQFQTAKRTNVVRSKIADIKRAKKALRYKPSVPLQKGLQSLYAWMKEEIVV